MDMTVIGASYLSAPSLWKPDFRLNQDNLIALYENPISQNCFILSTCNRLEIYSDLENTQKLFSLWKNIVELYDIPLEKPDYLKKQDAAIKHLIFVALGLYSRISGENQIVHQLKQTFGLALNHHKITPWMEIVVGEVLALNKKIRAQRQREESLESLVSAWIEKHPETQRNILIIGAGDVIQELLHSKTLIKAAHITLTNRTLARAQALQKILGSNKCSILEWEGLRNNLAQYSLIISAIETEKPILYLEDLSQKVDSLTVINLGHEKTLCPKWSQEAHPYRVLNLKDFESNLSSDGLDYESAIEETITSIKYKFLYLEKKESFIHFRKNLELQAKKIIDEAMMAYQHGVPAEIVIPQLGYKLQQKFLHEPSVSFHKSMIKSHHLDSFYNSDAISLSGTEITESL